MADLSITAADVAEVAGSGEKFAQGKAGATAVAGEAVYEDTADSFAYKLAKCDGTEAEATVVGIMMGGGADGQRVTIQTEGTLDVGGAATEGVTYALSDTAGKIAPIADISTATEYITIIGVGIASGHIKLNIFVSGAQVQ